MDRHPLRRQLIYLARVVLFVAGLCGIAYYIYALSNQYVYQAYENWAFDQHIAGRQVGFADYLTQQTPFGFLTRRWSTAKLARSEPANSGDVQPSTIPQTIEGSVLGRVQISRLDLSAIVREGVDEKTLNRAVGHLPYTALPGQTGNFAIAAHRDTLFRALKDIRVDDRITFQSPAGTYVYHVIWTKIVKPSDVSVLQAEGSNRFLTMITCYPFYYVGFAPKRFIVRASLVESETHNSQS